MALFTITFIDGTTKILTANSYNKYESGNASNIMGTHEIIFQDAGFAIVYRCRADKILSIE